MEYGVYPRVSGETSVKILTIFVQLSMSSNDPLHVTTS